jgi:hypothetical protein
VGMILDGKIALMKKEANVPPPPIIEKPKSQKQVEKISWTVKPNQNEKLVESTNDKRDGLKKTIKELMTNQN